MFNVYLLCTLHQSLWRWTKDPHIVLLASLQPCIVTYWHCIVWIQYNTIQFIVATLYCNDGWAAPEWQIGDAEIETFSLCARTSVLQYPAWTLYCVGGAYLPLPETTPQTWHLPGPLFYSDLGVYTVAKKKTWVSRRGFKPKGSCLPVFRQARLCLVDCPTQLICTWIFICVPWQSQS